MQRRLEAAEKRADDAERYSERYSGGFGRIPGGFGRPSETSSFNTDGRQVYKLHGPFRSMKTEAPTVHDAADVLALRLFLFNWLGSWSFVLRCANAEQALQSKADRDKYTAKWDEFANTYTDMSMKHLQMDVHSALSAHFREKCPFLIQFVDLGTSEDTYCATALWNNVISHYSPANPTVQALTYARIANALMKGSHASTAAYNKTINSSRMRELSSRTLSVSGRKISPCAI